MLKSKKLKIYYLGTVATVPLKFLNHPRIYIVPALNCDETLDNMFKLMLDLTQRSHSKEDDRVIDQKLGHIKLDKTAGAFHLVWCNARPKISTENILRGYPMQRKKKIKLLKFWVYNPFTRKPFKVILAVGEMIDIFSRYERTDEGYDRGGVRYSRDYNDEVEVVIDNIGSDCDGFYSSSYRGTIDFTRGYRGLRMNQLHGNYPRYRTPRIEWD